MELNNLTDEEKPPLIINAYIVTYFPNVDLLCSLINSVLKQGVALVYVFDNTDDINTANKIKILCENLGSKYINKGQNIGLSKAYNFLLKEYPCDWALLLDQDTTLGNDYVQVFKEILGSLHKPDKVIRIGAEGYYILDVFKLKYIWTFFCQNTGTFLNVKLFNKVGEFDEDLFMYHVDVEHCLRSWRNGYRVLCSPYLYCFHNMSITTFSTSAPLKSRNIFKKDITLFIKKYKFIYPIATIISIVLSSISSLLKLKINLWN